MNKGFSLIELMVTVSILSIGLVLVLRSFLSVTSALHTSQTLGKAYQFIDKKFSDLKEKTIVEGGIKIGQEEGTIALGARNATWDLKVAPIVVNEEDKILQDDLNEVTLTVHWREGTSERDAIGATYFENQK